MINSLFISLQVFKFLHNTEHRDSVIALWTCYFLFPLHPNWILLFFYRKVDNLTTWGLIFQQKYGGNLNLLFHAFSSQRNTEIRAMTWVICQHSSFRSHNVSGQSNNVEYKNYEINYSLFLLIPINKLNYFLFLVLRRAVIKKKQLTFLQREKGK